MPNWKFLVAHHFGGGQQRRVTCAAIKQLVEEQGLAHLLPLVKYEVGRGREYYLGVAIDLQAGRDDSVTETARQILSSAGVHSAANPQMSWVVDPEQVQGLLRGNLECESFTIPIVYETSEELEGPPIGQLLAGLDREDLCSAEPTAKEAGQQLRLLQWCSAVGSGDLTRLQLVCRALEITTEWGGAWSVLRRLVLLGHLEFDGGAAFRWGVVPPTAVQTMLAEDAVLFVGQRSPEITDRLREQFTVEEVPQAGGPSRLLLRGWDNSHADIEIVPGVRVACVGRAAEHLSRLLPRLDEWTARLPVWDERDFGRFAVECYVPEADEVRACAFSDAGARGLFRFTLEQPGRVFTTVAYRDEAGGGWVCGDFYGLRFLARVSLGLCRAAYREEQHQLVVPAADRWPMPYERALVLASGLLPQRIVTESGPALLVYDGLPREFAEAMCALVGVTLECG